MDKARAIEIIKELNINCNDTKDDVKEKIRKANLFNEISVFSGVSKICLFFCNADFVIKYSRDSYYNQDEEENEVLKEGKIYEKAKVAHLDMFFPYTEIIGEINNTYFILQEKIDFSVADCPNNKNLKYRKISRTATNKMYEKMRKGFYIEGCYCNRVLDQLWAEMALVIYGKTVCKNLCKFIQDNKINDLHKNNIGYKNNKPIILDFSGYFQ